MSTLVLDECQSRTVAASDGTVEVRDANGRLIGTLLRTDESAAPQPAELRQEVVDELIRRMSQENIRWSSTAEVLQRLGRQTAS